MNADEKRWGRMAIRLYGRENRRQGCRRYRKRRQAAALQRTGRRPALRQGGGGGGAVEGEPGFGGGEARVDVIDVLDAFGGEPVFESLDRSEEHTSELQ